MELYKKKVHVMYSTTLVSSFLFNNLFYRKLSYLRQNVVRQPDLLNLPVTKKVSRIVLVFLNHIIASYLKLETWNCKTCSVEDFGQVISYAYGKEHLKRSLTLKKKI